MKKLVNSRDFVSSKNREEHSLLTHFKLNFSIYTKINQKYVRNESFLKKPT